MALIQDKISFVSAIAQMVDVDLGVKDLVFGQPTLLATELIQYDSAVVEGVAPEYNSFRNTANVVTKDGKDIVTLAPVNFNEAISKNAIDATATSFGENPYGGGQVDARTQALLNGVGKLRLNHLVGEKKIIYEALSTHKIADGYVGKNGTEDIVFNVPAANKEVLATGLWNDPANSDPIGDMKNAVAKMKIKPSFVIMNQTTLGYFLASAKVRSADDTSNGKARNYFINEAANADADFYRDGRIRDAELNLDVYVEKGSRKTASGTVPYLADGYVIYGGSGYGEFYYGGIPMAVNGGMTMVAAEFDVSEVITQNPVAHDIIYRSAPLPVLKMSEGFYSQKTF